MKEIDDMTMIGIGETRKSRALEGAVNIYQNPLLAHVCIEARFAAALRRREGTTSESIFSFLGHSSTSYVGHMDYCSGRESPQGSQKALSATTLPTGLVDILTLLHVVEGLVQI